MKKIISVFVCMILALSMISSFAFAEEAVPANPAEEAAEAVVEEAPENPENAVTQEQGGVPASPYDQIMSGENLVSVDVPLSENGEIEILDYSVIEIPENEVVITDDMVNAVINNLLNAASETEVITEGTVETGDSINIDFSGKLEGEEEPFEGGTAQGVDAVLGSGMFIPGFEDQIAGHEIGETFDITVTFPETYAQEDLAGKNAIFTITINHKSVQNTPELNDEFAQKCSSENFEETLNTVDELKEFIKNKLYEQMLQAALMKSIDGMYTVVSYPEKTFNEIKEFLMADLISQADYYTAMGLEGYDVEMIAKMNGFADAESLIANEAKTYMDVIMFLDKVAENEGIEVTEEELDEMIESQMAAAGYDAAYTVDEFKELNGETWLMLTEKLNVLLNKVTDRLAQNVVFVEAQEPSEAVEETEVQAPVEP